MSNTPARVAPRPSLLLLAIIYLAFVSLGLPDSVLGVAWPAIRANLALPLELAGILALVGTLLSALSSFTVGSLTKRFGTGPIVLVSCLLTASGLLIYSQAPSFVFLILAGIPLGLGAGGVDSSLNAYVAKHYSARHMNWLHSFWGVGATIGPVVMTVAIASPASWRAGYLTIAAVQLTLALLFLVTQGLWKRNDRLNDVHSEVSEQRVGINGANSLAAWLSVAIYMLYVTIEFSVGLWSNTVLVSSRGVAPETAGLWTAAYYGSIMVGRILTGFVVLRFGNRAMVTFGLLTALVGSVLFFVQGVFWLPLVGLVLLGLGFAPVYPCLMHETPGRFIPGAAHVVIGRQVGGSYLAGAALPGLLGLALAHVSLELLAPALGSVLLLLLLLVHQLNRLSKV
ncbi:MAG: MFS transporter [Spirochaetales bacterium]